MTDSARLAATITEYVSGALPKGIRFLRFDGRTIFQCWDRKHPSYIFVLVDADPTIPDEKLRESDIQAQERIEIYHTEVIAAQNLQHLFLERIKAAIAVLLDKRPLPEIAESEWVGAA
jgi:hypothetical protein